MRFQSGQLFLRSAILPAVGVCLLSACGDTEKTATTDKASAASARPLTQVACNEAALRAHAAASQPARAILAEGRVSLVPPDSLPLMDYPNVEERDLTYVVDPGTSLVVSFLDDSLSAAQLQEMTAPLYGEDAKLSVGEPVEFGGARWERLGLTGNLVGVEQRSDIYITPFQGRTLMVNATVIPGMEEQLWQERLEASIATVEVRNCALTDSASAG